MKEYNFKRQHDKSKLPVFYSRLIMSFVLFFVIIAICSFNTNLKVAIRDILNQSYDFTYAKKECNIYINNFKDYLSDIKQFFVMEE